MNILCFGQCGPLQAENHSRIKHTVNDCFNRKETVFSLPVPNRTPQTINYYKCYDQPDCLEVRMNISVRYTNGTTTTEEIVLDCVRKTSQSTINYKLTKDFNIDRIPDTIINKICIKGKTRYTKIPAVVRGKMVFETVGLGCKKSTDKC